MDSLHDDLETRDSESGFSRIQWAGTHRMFPAVYTFHQIDTGAVLLCDQSGAPVEHRVIDDMIDCLRDGYALVTPEMVSEAREMASNRGPNGDRSRDNDRPQMQAPAIPGYFYIMESDGLYKLGITRKSVDARRRTIELASGKPVTVKTFKRVSDPSTFERQMHDLFPTARRHGEWFELTEAEMDQAINAMKEGI